MRMPGAIFLKFDEEIYTGKGRAIEESQTH